jgi:hypothetical protein
METVQTTITSRDGTWIAYETSGQGPSLILVGSMFERRAMDSGGVTCCIIPQFSTEWCGIRRSAPLY